ncbi:MAG: hypothetical protein AAF486_02935 [Pseudomonadota bacterium]
MNIAYLACDLTLPGARNRRSDAHEHDLMVAALAPALAERGLALTAMAWDAPGVDWPARFSAAIIGTTWDYWDRHSAFLQRLAEIECQVPLFNPATLVRWNSRKTYLQALARRGVPTIPTLWLDRVTEDGLARACAAFETEEVVIKRQIGAGADGQYKLSLGAPVPSTAEPMMVQPFLQTIEREGEISFIFIDGALCHAVLKRPKSGDYRIQSLYGGTEDVIDPAPSDREDADRVMAALDETPLYARVDMVRGPDGGLLLMELELIEPYLYPEQAPQLGERFAAALRARLQRGAEP